LVSAVPDMDGEIIFFFKRLAQDHS
jgi:hypothetical protein